jgi:hypothetical protein
MPSTPSSEDHPFIEVVEEYFEQVRDDLITGSTVDDDWEWHFITIAKFCDDAMYRKPDFGDLMAVL